MRYELHRLQSVRCFDGATCDKRGVKVSVTCYPCQTGAMVGSIVGAPCRVNREDIARPDEDRKSVV